jgi:hypothetical protein
VHSVLDCLSADSIQRGALINFKKYLSIFLAAAATYFKSLVILNIFSFKIWQISANFFSIKKHFE